MKRRRFLSHLLIPFLAEMAAGIDLGLSLKNRIFLIGDGERPDQDQFDPAIGASKPGILLALRADGSTYSRVALPFLPHSFAFMEKRPDKIVASEKWGVHLAEIDLQSSKISRLLKMGENERLFGHCTYDSNGDHLFATSMDFRSREGQVIVIRTKDFKIAHRMSSGGTYPHDCQFDGKTGHLLTVNSRTRIADTKDKRTGLRTDPKDVSSLVWLNPSTGRITDIKNLNNLFGGYAHFAKTENDGYLLTGSYQNSRGISKPMLSIVNSVGSVRHLLSPDSERIELKGEALSIAVDPQSNQFAVSLPQSNLIQIWNYRSNRLISQMNVHEPRAILLLPSQSQIVFSSARERKLFFRTAGISETAGATVTAPAGIGSHLVTMTID